MTTTKPVRILRSTEPFLMILDSFESAVSQHSNKPKIAKTRFGTSQDMNGLCWGYLPTINKVAYCVDHFSPLIGPKLLKIVHLCYNTQNTIRTSKTIHRKCQKTSPTNLIWNVLGSPIRITEERKHNIRFPHVFRGLDVLKFLTDFHALSSGFS